MDARFLAPGEGTKQEAQADGYGHGRKWVAPDRLHGLMGRVHRLVLRAAELLVGDAADREVSVWISARMASTCVAKSSLSRLMLLLLAALVRISLSEEDMGLLFLEETQAG